MTGSASRAGSPIGLTRSCCASWRGPTITASGCLEPDSDETKALRALTRGREDLVGAGRRWSTSCAPSSSGSGPGRSGCSAICTVRSRWRSSSATRARPTRAGWARRASGGFLARERYSGRQKPAQLLAKLKAAPEGRVGERELATRRQLVLGAGRDDQDAQRADHGARAADRHRHSRASRRRRSSSRCSKAAVITAAELLAEMGDCRAPLPHPRRARRRRRPGRGGDRVRQAQNRAAFAGAATSGCAKRSTRWLTAPATGTPGRRISTPKPAPVATTTPARCAPSAAPGPGSCGAAGKIACPTTPPATARCNDTSLSPSPRRRAPCPTSLPPSGWPAPLSPEGRPAGPSAQRLTASRHPLSHPRG